MSHQKFFYLLLALFSAIFIALAIAPHHRADWALENVLVVVLLFVMVVTVKSFPLSRLSYGLIFIFLSFHEIGAHYTYARVPYDAFFTSLFGISLNDMMGWERNHFDRFIHFAFGLLLAYPIKECYYRIANTAGFWGYFFPLELTMAASMMFELFEWAAVILFGGDLGVAYLGTQGDIWDAQKDMALASLGALITMSVTALINMRIQRDFDQEWNLSLRIKHQKPLGEDEIERLINEQK